jgi:transposase-like protein
LGGECKGSLLKVRKRKYKGEHAGRKSATKLILNLDITSIRHIHTKRNVESIQKLRSRMFLFLNKFPNDQSMINSKMFTILEKKYSIAS